MKPRLALLSSLPVFGLLACTSFDKEPVPVLGGTSIRNRITTTGSASHVKEKPFISGVVVDTAGRPLGGIGLRTAFQPSKRMAFARTNIEGTFKLYRVNRSPDRVAIQVYDPGPLCEKRQQTEKYAWGAAGVKIILRRLPSLAMEVVETKSGKPVEEFAVYCFESHDRLFPFGTQLRHSGHHSGGRLTIKDVRHGPGRLMVVPKDMRLLTTKTTVEVGHRTQPYRIQLTRLVPMKLLVLDASGKLAEKIQVLVITPGNYRHPSGRESIRDPRYPHLGPVSSDPKTTYDTMIFRSTTDAAGQCIVYGIDGREDLVLRFGHGEKSQRIADVAFGSKHSSRKIRLKD